VTPHAISPNAAARAGFRMDQTFNLVKGDAWLQERQLIACDAARHCAHAVGPTAIGYGGAQGSGKSHWLFALRHRLLRRILDRNRNGIDDQMESARNSDRSPNATSDT